MPAWECKILTCREAESPVCAEAKRYKIPRYTCDECKGCGHLEERRVYSKPHKKELGTLVKTTQKESE
jgi:hypothetical protein